MDTLLDNFRNVYRKEYHEQYKIMAQTCDELRHLVLFLRHIASSSNNEQKKKLPIDLSSPFRTMIQDLKQSSNYLHTGRTSVQMTHDAGRGTRRLITPTSNHSPVPSFSCRQIDPVTISPPKVISFSSLYLIFIRLSLSYVYFVKDHLIIVMMRCIK